jgi:hypothetical protein
MEITDMPMKKITDIGAKSIDCETEMLALTPRDRKGIASNRAIRGH